MVGDDQISKFPFPIMTALGSEVRSTELDLRDNEEWIEFTPFAVQPCRRAKRQAIKMSHFGGVLTNGLLPGDQSNGDVVADEIGQLMALWGTAFISFMFLFVCYY
jgi:hypothetical protein